jgi:hypothetical protein
MSLATWFRWSISGLQKRYGVARSSYESMGNITGGVSAPVITQDSDLAKHHPPPEQAREPQALSVPVLVIR